MSVLKQQFVIFRGATDRWQHEVVYYTTFFILDVVFMSEFLFYSVDTFLKTIDCELYGLQWLELNKIGTKRTMGVLNICHRPVFHLPSKQITQGQPLNHVVRLYLCLRIPR